MTNHVPTILDLNDIVEPGDVAGWQLAPALAGLLLVLLIGLLLFVIAAGIRRHRNAYRREGLRLLNRQANDAAIRILLKRVALVSWPRDVIAPLHGEAWIEFLNTSCARARFTGDTAREELSNQAAIWIRHHRRDAC